MSNNQDTDVVDVEAVDNPSVTVAANKPDMPRPQMRISEADQDALIAELDAIKGRYGMECHLDWVVWTGILNFAILDAYCQCRKLAPQGEAEPAV